MRKSKNWGFVEKNSKDALKVHLSENVPEKFIRKISKKAFSRKVHKSLRFCVLL